MSRRIYFDRKWKFHETFNEEMISNMIMEGENVNLPHTCKEVPFHYFDESAYQMICAYQRIITPDDAWQGKKLLLTFDAIGHRSEVYFNGKKLYVIQSYL